MSRRQPAAGDPRGPAAYRISVQGHLAHRWAGWFDDLSLTNESDGTTVLQGQVIDQAALHGLLQRVRDTGLPLLSVVRVDSHETDSSNADLTPPPDLPPPDPGLPTRSARSTVPARRTAPAAAAALPHDAPSPRSTP